MTWLNFSLFSWVELEKKEGTITFRLSYIQFLYKFSHPDPYPLQDLNDLLIEDCRQQSCVHQHPFHMLKKARATTCLVDIGGKEHKCSAAEENARKKRT